MSTKANESMAKKRTVEEKLLPAAGRESKGRTSKGVHSGNKEGLGILTMEPICIQRGKHYRIELFLGTIS